MTCEIVNVTDTAWDCMFDGYLDTSTELQLGLMVSLMVAVPLYAKYEDPVMPAVGLALVAGVMWPVLPSFAKGVAWVILFAALTLAVFTIMYRTVLT